MSKDDDMHSCHVGVSNVFPLRQKGGGACRVDGRDEKTEGQTSAGARGVFLKCACRLSLVMATSG